MAGKKKTIDALAPMAKMVGVDIEAIKAELIEDIIARLPSPPSGADTDDRMAQLIDQVAALKDQVSARKDQVPEVNTVGIETRLSNKMVDALENINRSLTASVDEVRKELISKFTMMEGTIYPLIEQTVQANIPGMIQSIATQLEQNAAKNPTQPGTQTVAATGNGGGLSAFAQRMPPEFWVNLASSIFGHRETDLGTLVRGIKLGNALKTGSVTPDEIDKAINP